MRLKTSTRKLSCLIGLGGLLFGLSIVSPAIAASASARTAPETCTGTPTAPGVLTGTYDGNVVVSGICAVNAGQAVVEGNLTVTAGGALNATFARNDKTKSAYSNLTVTGNLYVDAGATLGMGCDPTNSPCSDDPTPKSPTLSSWDWVGGDLIATDPLGVILHNSFVAENIVEQGGGGGYNCKEHGVFVALKSPVFSDYENVVVGGNMTIKDLRTCWLGSLRDDVHGNFSVIDNKMADPDADEVNTNYVNGSLTCLANSPAVQFGDSGGSANVVNGAATGQCSFGRLVPNPPPKGTPQHISVPQVP